MFSDDVHILLRFFMFYFSEAFTVKNTKNLKMLNIQHFEISPVAEGRLELSTLRV